MQPNGAVNGAEILRCLETNRFHWPGNASAFYTLPIAI
jgi:hypothetical protein